MPSKLESFLKDKKIDRRVLLVVSSDLEGLRQEDRAIRLAKRQGAAAKAAGKELKDQKPAGKRRSGRPLTKVTLDKVFAGKPVSGPTKTRLLRAVNAVLERRKQEKVALDAIFDLAKK